MNRVTPVSAIIAALAVVSATAVESTRFPFMKDVTPPAVLTGEVAAFTVDADVFDKLDNRQANLRLFDDTGREQPSLIRQRIPVRTTTCERAFTVPAPAESFRQLPDNRIEIIVNRDPNLPAPCGLRLDSGIRNFEKMVTVSASSDGQNWTTLVNDEAIYDYSRFVDIRKDTIRFPPANFTRFRLEISNITEKKDSPLVEIIRQTRGAGDANEVEATSFRKEAFRIERLIFLERVTETVRRGEPETGEFVVSGWSVTNDAKTRQTVIEFTTRRQPLVTVTVGTDDRNFSRPVTVEGTDAADRKTWRRIAADRISRVHAGVIRQDSLAIHFPGESRCRAYRIVISDQDNPPLTITRLTAEERRYETLFFPKPGLKYRAFYGGDGILPAEYDIGTVLSACPTESACQWSLGSESRNPSFKVVVRKAKVDGKVFMTASIVAMAVVLAVLIARLIRKVDLEPRD